MNLIFNTKFVLFVLISLKLVSQVVNQSNHGIRSDLNIDRKNRLIFCTISVEEQRKCEHWSEAIRSVTRTSVNAFEYELDCKMASDKDQCMNWIESLIAHLTVLDPGELFTAGRYHSLVPIMYELYGSTKEKGYYSVAVVKTQSSSYIRDLRDLRGKKACFTGVGHLSGWVIPISRLLDEELFDIRDCNNIIRSAASFFGDSCAPNSLIDKNNPIGNNPLSICSLCSAADPDKSKCSGNDIFANFEGAFQCLSRVGDVAFLKHTTINEISRYKNINKNDYELLCPNGGRRPINAYQDCNWGYVPSHAIVISSATLPEDRHKIQKFLFESVNRFGAQLMHNKDYITGQSMRPSFNRFNQSFTSKQNLTKYNLLQFDDRFRSDGQFPLFGDSVRYGAMNLLFADETTSLNSVEISKQTFAGYLRSYELPARIRFDYRSNITNILDYFEKLRKCPVPNARFCVVSDQELEKCQRMKTAFHAQMLKPELTCVKGHSTIGCMSMIHDGNADLTVLDAGDIYTGGHKFNLEPIVSEQNNLNDTYYYSVAITRQSDKNTDLLYLKGKKSCHSGFGLAAGWVVPLSFLLSNSRMRSYGCDSVRAASEFFQKSCIPGSLSREFYSYDSTWDYGNLCDLCHGASYRFCSRDSSEPFFGDTGALRCLVEGGGEIAFTKHTSILENTGGRNPDWWARNVIPDDFELLCRDGTRATYQDYKNCHLGRVPTNAIVNNKYNDILMKEAFINLFIYAQQFYGSKYSEDFTFKMFVSHHDYKDLIFQDSTVQLKAIPYWRRDYRQYLGHEFLKAMTIVDCTAGALNNMPSFLTLLLVIISFYNSHTFI
ncbi:melanotransferrin-like [Oppia nitens]|uniref:melanotransferrin-like n=1 Tax=Oppia nitens TaxID=1686743 RepID=UPI0023DC0DF7|nr:melanotransferrin-like [Oppia nitens]